MVRTLPIAIAIALMLSVVAVGPAAGAQNIDTTDIEESPDVADYADDDGIVRMSGLNEAIGDYLLGEIDNGLLNDVIRAYLLGTPVGSE